MPITQDNAHSILLLLEDWHRAHGLSLCLAACQKLVEYINFNFVEGEATPPSSPWGSEAMDMELHAVFLRKGDSDGEELGLSFGNIPIFGDPDMRKKGIQRKRRDQGPVLDVGCIWVTEVRKRSPACCCGRIKLRDEVLSVNGQLMVGVDVNGASYLADQCWNGGCVYLILLRRVKKKAPPPPCDVSIPFNSISCEDLHQNQHQNQRMRKFGVISRSSFHRDNPDGSDPELHRSQNSCSPSLHPDGGLSSSLENSDCVAFTERRGAHVSSSAGGSSPSTVLIDFTWIFHQCLCVCSVSQHREDSHIWRMHMVKGQEGLGIHITGGRGSKRCPHGIIIARIEEGGAIHRYREPLQCVRCGIKQKEKLRENCVRTTVHLRHVHT
uniref:PDZ domain-containing protein n=1 Tax=Oryzias melastigma TaxID=30732 RepID=A0A3B3BB82_ORYME